jgi:hypothetical protein
MGEIGDFDHELSFPFLGKKSDSERKKTERAASIFFEKNGID